jgi:hypothetical protein
MGEDDAKVSLVAGSEAEEGFEARDEHEAGCEYEHELEWEYEDGGLWVGTVGAMEMEWGKETPTTADALGLPCNGNSPRERGTGEQIEERSDFQGEEDRAEEAAEDEWWDLGAESPEPEDVGVNAVQVEPPPPRSSQRTEAQSPNCSRKAVDQEEAGIKRRSTVGGSQAARSTEAVDGQRPQQRGRGRGAARGVEAGVLRTSVV